MIIPLKNSIGAKRPVVVDTDCVAAVRAGGATLDNPTGENPDYCVMTLKSGGFVHVEGTLTEVLLLMGGGWRDIAQRAMVKSGKRVDC